jgi:hypothetical protein
MDLLCSLENLRPTRPFNNYVTNRFFAWERRSWETWANTLSSVENTLMQALNSHVLNSCSRLYGTWELRKLMQTLASQLSSTLMQLLFSFDQGGLRKHSCKLSLLSTLINSHATLVLFWPGHESWENSHTDTRFSTLINSRVTLDSCSLLTGAQKLRTLMQTLASQLSSTLMQLLFSFDRGTRVEKTLMQTLASQLSSTLMQLLFSFDRGTRVEKTLMQTLTSQLSSTLMQLLFSFDRGTRVEKTLMQTLASNSQKLPGVTWALLKAIPFFLQV